MLLGFARMCLRPSKGQLKPHSREDANLQYVLVFQAELTAHLALQRERAELEGSGFTGRCCFPGLMSYAEHYAPGLL